MAENVENLKSNAKDRISIKCPRCGHEQQPSESCVSCGLGFDYIPGIKRGDPAPIEVLIKEAWKLFKLRFPVLIVISIIYNLFVLATNFDYYLNNKPSNPEEIEYAKLFAINLAWFIVYAWSIGAYVSAITDKSLPIGKALETGVRLLSSYLWITLIVFVFIMLGFLALVVPGVILMVRYAFREFALLCENKRGYDALRRSSDYVKGRWFRVFGRLLPVWILLFVPAFLPQAIGLLLLILLIPFSYVYTYILYQSLRGELVAGSSPQTEGRMPESETVQ